MACNPCNTNLTNTAACESLPSQISNFVEQFFGTIIRTEVDGQVVWTLPGDLNTGLPNNQRAPGEGLAVYFLRLFEEGIVGLTGPAGADGATGAAGRNAYTVTLQAFTQPSSGSPNIQVLTAYNPAILVGSYLLIQDSGYYLVTAVDTGGSVFATLYQAFPSVAAGSTVNAGKLVVIAGVPGASVQGEQGPQGNPGTPGSDATGYSVNNGIYYAPVGTDYNLPISYAAVDFAASSPVITLTAAGTYRVNVTADLVGLSGVATTDNVYLKLYNTNTAADVPGTEHSINNFVDTARSQISITTQVITTGTNQQIALYGKCDTADKVAVVALRTTIVFERLA